METLKKCNECGLELPETEEYFYWRIKNIKYKNICRVCNRKKAKKYRDNKLDKVKTAEYQKEYGIEHKEEIKIRRKEYYESNKNNISEYKRKWDEENKEYLKNYYKEYKQKHKERIKVRDIEYRKNNKEKCISNREKYKPIRRKREKQRRKNDTTWKLKQNVGRDIWTALKKQNSYKNNSVWKLLPYTPQQLKEHLEKQFEPWMNWGNYGKASIEIKTWNIDHIVPQSKLLYDSLDHPNFLECWKLENLRPLEAIENIKKGNK